MTALDQLFRSAGAADWGGVDYQRLFPFMSPQARQRLEALCPSPRTVLVAAFPYYAGMQEGNLSLYARGADYHRVLSDKLTTICHSISADYPQESFFPAADNSPLPEREVARLSGLGMMGRHGLLIVPPYGSYLFLGTILTSARLNVPKRPPAPMCENCGRCVAACPGGALGADGFHVERCLSHLTQKKGTLPPEEAALVAAHPYLWGCDLCQRACPHNAHCALSPLPEFREHLLHSLTEEDLEGLSNRTFREKYGERAFAWRGPAVLRRNLALQKKQTE